MVKSLLTPNTTGRESISIIGDISVEADVQRLIQGVVEKFGELNVVESIRVPLQTS